MGGTEMSSISHDSFKASEEWNNLIKKAETEEDEEVAELLTFLKSASEIYHEFHEKKKEEIVNLINNSESVQTEAPMQTEQIGNSFKEETMLIMYEDINFLEFLRYKVCSKEVKSLKYLTLEASTSHEFLVFNELLESFIIGKECGNNDVLKILNDFFATNQIINKKEVYLIKSNGIELSELNSRENCFRQFEDSITPEYEYLNSLKKMSLEVISLDDFKEISVKWIEEKAFIHQNIKNSVEGKESQQKKENSHPYVEEKKEEKALISPRESTHLMEISRVQQHFNDIFKYICGSIEQCEDEEKEHYLFFLTQKEKPNTQIYFLHNKLQCEPDIVEINAEIFYDIDPKNFNFISNTIIYIEIFYNYVFSLDKEGLYKIKEEVENTQTKKLYDTNIIEFLFQEQSDRLSFFLRNHPDLLNELEKNEKDFPLKKYVSLISENCKNENKENTNGECSTENIKKIINFDENYVIEIDKKAIELIKLFFDKFVEKLEWSTVYELSKTRIDERQYVLGAFEEYLIQIIDIAVEDIPKKHQCPETEKLTNVVFIFYLNNLYILQGDTGTQENCKNFLIGECQESVEISLSDKETNESSFEPMATEEEN